MKQKSSGSPTNKLRLLRTGDPHSGFHRFQPREILDQHGPPRSLLSTSTKMDKCLSVGVQSRVLYLTPGVYCPRATDGCIKACLGHTSGRMCLPSSSTARDQRTALYVEEQPTFLRRLQAELTLLEADALQMQAVPSVRLNGTSDLPWEKFHPELFRQFPGIQFFDYTKIESRMLNFLGVKKQSLPWPSNYHLTFSADGGNFAAVKRILDLRGTAAVVFWPELPSRWRGFPVLDGDTHDARFLDPKGRIVGLRAKGLARVDRSGFTVRVCPRCHTDRGRELSQVGSWQDSHVHTRHRCSECGFELTARWKRATPDCRLTPSNGILNAYAGPLRFAKEVQKMTRRRMSAKPPLNRHGSPAEAVETIESIKAVLDYLWDAEFRDYRACEGEKDRHIFRHLLAIQKWLDGSDGARELKLD